MRYTEEDKRTARSLYLRKVKVPDIEKKTGVPRRTLYSWIKNEGWVDQQSVCSVLEALDRRCLTLLEKPEGLTGGELNELERLMVLRDKEFKIQGQVTAGTVFEAAQEAQQTSALMGSGNSKKKRKRAKNDFTGISAAEVEQKFLDKLFQYQKDAWRTRKKRNRFILKSRQIGWTFYCAREAFADALIEGKNQAFLSASKAQAQLFRSYIASFAMDWFGVELKGTEKIVLKTDHGDVTLFFLSTNSQTAQGPSGNVYIDECFWINNFKKLRDLAGAIASHKHWRKTYFSTPSTESHEAFLLWSGKEYEAIQAKRPELPPWKMPTKAQLRKGVDCVDGMYRQVITIHDAIKGGCDLFDVQQLEAENDPDTFAQLYECKFINDKGSAFKLDELVACIARDARWPDYKPLIERPFANKPVWVGYDPSRSRDGAVITVLAPPAKPGGKFRVLERITMLNKNWAYQAEEIRKITQRYNVQHIGIDMTGPGSGVYERVLEFYPAAHGITYSVETKTKLVLKAQEVIGNNRIEWPEEMTDIPSAFLAIRQTSTGQNITYVAKRDNNIGHADSAWSIMHALINEGLSTSGRRKTTVAIGQ